ncbi:hypothetical protein ACFDTO_23375 [Microbacteriaceae bacterium 4G12]
MQAQAELDEWEHLKKLYDKMLLLEKKLTEKMEKNESWEAYKHFVYSALIIGPALILLVTLELIAEKRIHKQSCGKKYEYFV